jgi:DNA-binding response OmpR family regulator
MVSTGGAQRIILVVEDEPAIRGFLALTLQAEDYTVVTAEDGQDALTKLEDQRPDAMVLDLMLPMMNGWQVIDALDRDTQEERIPIIAVSAGLDKVAVGERGVRAFLSKPFEVDTLLVTLDQVLH